MVLAVRAASSNGSENRLIILIEQLGESSIQPDGSQSWNVQIVSGRSYTDLNRETIHEKLRIDDFFGREQRADVSHYLNDLLRTDRWTNNHEIEAKRTSDAIFHFGSRLLQSLKLEAWAISHALEGKDLEIEICTKSGFIKNSSGSFRSIQCLFWELLEERSHWKTHIAPRSIRVRRHVEKSRRIAGEAGGPQLSGEERRMTPTIKGNVEEFNILIVVARKTQLIDNLSSTIAQTAVVKMCMELVLEGSLQRVYAHVVRPGTYDQLKNILKENKGLFQVIHFDMHGGVLTKQEGSTQSPSAYLQFNSRHGDNLADHYLKGCELSDLADLLIESNIDCVVLGACQTAHADVYAHANLSWVFVDKGVKNVLAMSYNMSDTMSDFFFHKFYYELFIGRKEFSQSARLARRWLSVNSDRWYYEGKKWLPLQDWFVPIVYSDGTLSRMIPGKCSFWRVNRLKVLYTSANWLWLVFYLIYPPLALAFTKGPSGSGVSRRFTVIFVASAYYLIGLLSASFWKRYLCSRKLGIITSLEETHKDKKNILRLEDDLCRSERVFFYSRDAEKAQRLLRHLVILWELTHLVCHTVTLDAAYFMQKSHWRVSVANRQIDNWKEYSREKKGVQNPRMLVVIENIMILYPDVVDTKPDDLENQARFQDWLKTNFEVGNHVPYLIIIGQGARSMNNFEHAKQTKIWFDANIGVYGEFTNTMKLTMFQDTSPRYLIPEEPNYYPVSRRPGIAQE